MASPNGSPPVTAKMAGAIKWLLEKKTLAQHQIAALFGINQGRVSEIKTGKRFAEVRPTDPSDLGLTF